MKIHIVQKGDSLWKIAQKYNVNFDELKKSNSQLSNPDMIMPGMKIKVPMAGVPVKKEGQVMGVTKEAPQVMGVKEAPKAPHPYKEMPKKPAVKEAPVKEAPKAPYVPKMPQLKPYFPEIDVNNYYTVNVPITKQSAHIQMPPLPKVPKPKEEIPKPVVKGVEAPKPMPLPPEEYCVPVSPVMPGTGIPDCPPCPPHYGMHGMHGMHGMPGMMPQGMPGMHGMPGMMPGMPMGQMDESHDFDMGQMQAQMQQFQQMGQMPQMGQEEYDPTAVAGVQDQMQMDPQAGMQPGMMMPGMHPGMMPGMHPGMMPGMHPGMMPGMHPGMMPGMQPGMMPGMHPGMMPGMQPGMMPGMHPGMPMGPWGGGYPCYPVSPVSPGAGFGPMGDLPYGQAPQGVAGATDDDCGCGPSPQQMYREQVPYGYPQAPYGMYPAYGHTQAGYPALGYAAPSYFGPHGYGYGYTNDHTKEERNDESDFDGPEYDDES